MKFWEKFSSFSEANDAWDKKAGVLDKKAPLKKVSFNPKIKKSENTNTLSFRLRSFFYLLRQDKKLKLLRYFLKRVFFYAPNLIKSYFKKKPYLQDDDLYFYNLDNFKDLEKSISDKNSIIVFGFSYCHKPLECPLKRFSEECIHDPTNDICAQCFIGKCANATYKDDIFLVIPDVKFIGQKLFEITQKNPKKDIIFILTSCSFSIDMFSDFANMLKIKGLAIKLAGRVCINYKSFLYAEKGIKPGLTVLEKKNQKKILDLLNHRWLFFDSQ